MDNESNSLRVTCSLDWNNVSSALNGRISDMPALYRADLRKMLNNIEAMVRVLSQHEVTARRTRNFSAVTLQLDQINNNIVMIDKYIVTAILMR